MTVLRIPTTTRTPVRPSRNPATAHPVPSLIPDRTAGLRHERNDALTGIRFIQPGKAGAHDVIAYDAQPRMSCPRTGYATTIGRRIRTRSVDSTLLRIVPMQMHLQEGMFRMPANPDPDETDVLDLRLAHRELYAYVNEDGVINAREQRLLDIFDLPTRRLGLRTRVRKSVESLLRNGANRYTKANAEDAGIAVIVDISGRVIDLVPSESVSEDPIAA